MTATPSIAALILAAGSSSRMGAGRHKLLLPLAGRPVLAHVVAAALRSQARPVLAVVGHEAAQVRAVIEAARAQAPSRAEQITIIENPVYQQGMSSSLRAGLRALQQLEPPVDGALILLGDQPFVSADVLNALIGERRATGKRIVAPLYAGRRGNPVLFAAELFPELLQIEGDEGGRSVLKRHPEELASVEVGDAMTDYDVDTWEAYQQALTTLEAQIGEES